MEQVGRYKDGGEHFCFAVAGVGDCDRGRVGHCAKNIKRPDGY